jgi:hypothetical protein
MDGACSTYERDEKCIKILIGELEGKIPLRRPRSRWEDDIRMDLMEIW